MVILAMLLGGGLYVFKSCRDIPLEVINKTGNALSDVVSAFKQKGTITTTFTSFASTITNSQYLQFATLKQQEIFTRSEQPSTAFGYIGLPEVVVEARAPVEYTYYLDLNAQWKLTLRDGVIHVFTPPIRFNKPAVDASAITYEVRKGYVKSDEALENLKKSITGLVVIRGKDNIGLVRETGRKQATEFVEKWLVKSFADGKSYPVKVYFPGEKPPEGVSIKNPGAD